LSRSLKDRSQAAFAGADLYTGRKQLVEPSLAQAAVITGSDVSSVWWALQRERFRDDILGGWMPLVPPRKKEKKPPPLAPIVYGNVDDAAVIDFARNIGIARVLDAAVAVEAAQ
jgi:hypothetical protein